jgi:hypothetical protein
MSALLNRKELYDRLSKNVVDLYFTKVDGTKRRMQATLMESITGAKTAAPTGKSALDESGAFPVYDCELNDWRAFRIEKVSTVLTPSIGELKTDGTDRL